MDEKTSYPCLIPGTHIYTGCKNTDCEFFDTLRLVKGCIFFPTLNRAGEERAARRLRKQQANDDVPES